MQRAQLTDCCRYDAVRPSPLKLPKYFNDTQYRNPEDSRRGPFQFAHETDLENFEFNMQNPELFARFNNYMAGYAEGRPSWMWGDFYPVGERLIKGSSQSVFDVLLVDVGGGRGHDLAKFKETFDDVSGRLVLQDLPDVVNNIQDLDPKIEQMAHDFTTPQPVLGARACFMHSILHDWSDEKCVLILKHLAKATKKGYSKILVYEIVLPDQGADPSMTALDLIMLATLASRERTEMQWRELAAHAGLEVAGIWSHPDGIESLIELV